MNTQERARNAMEQTNLAIVHARHVFFDSMVGLQPLALDFSEFSRRCGNSQLHRDANQTLQQKLLKELIFDDPEIKSTKFKSLIHFKLLLLSRRQQQRQQQ